MVYNISATEIDYELDDVSMESSIIEGFMTGWALGHSNRVRTLDTKTFDDAFDMARVVVVNAHAEADKSDVVYSGIVFRWRNGQASYELVPEATRRLL